MNFDLRPQRVVLRRGAGSALRQLTAEYASLGELADPAAPLQEEDGRVRLYGTGGYCLEFASWEKFLAGAPAARIPVTLEHPNGTALGGQWGAWDLAVHDWVVRGSVRRVLYAGAMSPTGRRKQPRWPEDNWTRRLYAFRPDGPERWVRDEAPLLGESLRGGWLGHSYGHHFLEDDDGVTWVFYEKVIEERRDGQGGQAPWLTEIFARRMRSPYEAAAEEVRVLGVGAPPYPATGRRHPRTGKPNGFLVEGPRPVRAVIGGRTFYLLGFSSGDFPTDGYGINVAWSTEPLGPYVPLLAPGPQGTDLLDLGADLRRRHRLSWGPGRPCFFPDPANRWWALFHAVRKDVRPESDYSRWPRGPLGDFHRNVYLAPLRLRLDGNGAPSIHIDA